MKKLLLLLLVLATFISCDTTYFISYGDFAKRPQIIHNVQALEIIQKNTVLPKYLSLGMIDGEILWMAYNHPQILYSVDFLGNYKKIVTLKKPHFFKSGEEFVYNQTLYTVRKINRIILFEETYAKGL